MICWRRRHSSLCVYTTAQWREGCEQECQRWWRQQQASKITLAGDTRDCRDTGLGLPEAYMFHPLGLNIGPEITQHQHSGSIQVDVKTIIDNLSIDTIRWKWTSVCVLRECRSYLKAAPVVELVPVAVEVNTPLSEVLPPNALGISTTVYTWTQAELF